MRKIAVISIIMVALILGNSAVAMAGGGLRYVVKSGDTLAKIGMKHGVDYHIIMENNNLNSDLIRPGMELYVPNEGPHIYSVKRGDSLWEISRKYGVSVEDIKKINQLTSNNLPAGLKLVIFKKNSSSVVAPAVKPVVKPVTTSRGELSKEDIKLLAKLIYAEARGESLEGQIAVGAVIINRLRSSAFPDTIRNVIYQRTRNGYQFSPVGNGQIKLEPDRTAYYAAEQAIKGNDPTGGAVFFYNPKTSSDKWIRTLPIQKVIGNHVFASSK